MTIRVEDSFTDAAGTALISHTGETGAAWGLGTGFLAGATPIIDSTGQRVKGGANPGAQAQASGVATNDGERVDVVWDFLTANPGFGVFIRSHRSLGGVSRGYLAYFVGEQVKVLRQENSASWAPIGVQNTLCSVAVANDVPVRVKATGTGSSVTIEVYYNGALVLSVVDSSAGRITTLGSCGLQFEDAGSDTQYAHAKSMTLDDTVEVVSTTPPGQVTGLAAGTATDTSVPLSWSSATGAASYTVNKRPAGGSTWTAAATGLTSTLYTVQGLAASTGYEFQVFASNQYGDGAPSATVSKSTPAAAPPPPAAPTLDAPRIDIMNFADLVKETGPTISGSTITLAGTAATGHRTFASAYPVGTRGIPVFFGDAANGGAYLIGRVSRTTSNTLTVDKLYSSSAGGAMPSFGAGAKEIYCTLPASQVIRKDFIDAGDYAIDPTFTEDSTAGIQAAINDAFAAGISVVRIPYGHYKIAGPLQTNVGGYSPNSQLYIPQSREGAPNRTIIIEGASPPNFEAQILRNVPPPTNGVVLESTIAGSGASPAVIAMVPGNGGDTAGWQFNYTNVGVRDIGIRVNVKNGANTMGGLNFKEANQIVDLDRVRIDINMGLFESPNPTTADSSGLIIPRVNNHLLMNGGMIYVSGFANGIIADEHTCFLNATIIGCYNAVVLQNTNHASYIGLLSIEGCVNSIVINGNHGIAIGQYDCEHLNVPGTWYQFEKDIKYLSGSRKVTILQSTVVVANVGVSDAAWVTNATSANYKVVSGAGAN